MASQSEEPDPILYVSLVKVRQQLIVTAHNHVANKRKSLVC